MFSRRVPSDFTENSIARTLRGRTRPYIDLTASNPTAAGLSPSDEEISGALSRPGLGRYQPDPKGLRSAREAISAEYARKGLEADPERIFLTSSTSEAYAFLFKLLCDPGDFVLVPEPSYPLFDHLTALEGVRRRPYRLSRKNAGDWRIEIPGILEGFEAGARALLLVHPNNPTGSYVKREEIRELERALDPGAHSIISDEVFFDFRLRDSDAVRLGSADSSILTFSLSGLSKSCALPQMKLAWILLGGPREAVARASERLELIADTYLSVSSAVQLALPQLLEIGRPAARRIQERLLQNVAAATELLSTADLPEGGWSLPVELASGSDEEKIVLELLERHDVLVSPGWFFEFDHPYLVLSLIVAPGDFREGAARIAAYLAR